MKRLVALMAAATLFSASAFAGGEPEEVDVGPEEFFQQVHDELEIIVSWSPGGGTDTQARLMQPFLEANIAGNPDVYITNIEGGGGIEGHNEFALRRTPDGSNMLFSAGSSKVPFLLDRPGVRYDFAEMQPAFGVPAGSMIYARPDVVEDIDDLLSPAEQLRFGSIGVASTDAIVLLAWEVLGLTDEVQSVFGYAGSGDIRVAYEGGELNINRDSTSGYLGNVEPLVDAGEAVPLFTLGQVRDGELVRDPAFPDFPHVGEVHEQLYGEAPSGEMWELYKAVNLALFGLEKVMWFQADAPEAAVEAVKRAGIAMAQDEQFMSELQNIVGPYDLIVGDEIDAAVSDMLATLTPEARQDFLAFLEENYDM